MTRQEATIACQPRGCCTKGEFIPGVSKNRCVAAKGTYTTEYEASSRCKKEEVGWCCLPGGSSFRTTPERCKRQQEGLYFEAEKNALRNCKPIG